MRMRCQISEREGFGQISKDNVAKPSKIDKKEKVKSGHGYNSAHGRTEEWW
jgi:hypothetical protein